MNKARIKKHTTDYHKDLIEALKNEHEAESYLQVALEEYDEDGDYEAHACPKTFNRSPRRHSSVV